MYQNSHLLKYFTNILRNDNYRRYEPVWIINKNNDIPYFDLKKNKPIDVIKVKI